MQQQAQGIETKIVAHRCPAGAKTKKQTPVHPTFDLLKPGL
jgi:hypothetical protein